jgi:hypothetical protein
VLGLLRKVDFETRLSIAEEFKAVKKYKEAVQCLLSAAKMLKITSDTSGILEGALLSYQRGYYAEAYEEIKNTLSQLARKK